jgi:hypothetical protein
METLPVAGWDLLLLWLVHYVSLLLSLVNFVILDITVIKITIVKVKSLLDGPVCEFVKLNVTLTFSIKLPPQGLRVLHVNAPPLKLGTRHFELSKCDLLVTVNVDQVEGHPVLVVLADVLE